MIYKKKQNNTCNPFGTNSIQSEPNLVCMPEKVSETQPFKLLCAFEMEVIFGSNAT